MKKNNYILAMFSLLIACKTMKSMEERTAFDAFKVVLCGVFDNKNQVDAEKKASKQLHPYAKHITALFSEKIKNKPKDLKGYFILEESYYTYEGKPMEIKPYLFYIENIAADKIQLSSYTIPADISKTIIRNDNPNFSLDFSEISVSKTFKPAIYTFKNSVFTVNHSTDLPNDMRFTLIENLTKDRLEVMELLEKGGKRLTPYETPIIFERVK